MCAATEWITTSTILRDLHDYENQVAWRRLVDRFRRPIVEFACSAGLAISDAEDVAQETLVAFAQGFRNGKYDPTAGRLSNWLFGIASNKVLKGRERRVRIAGREKGDTPVEEMAAHDSESLTASWQREWEAALWAECIARVRDEFEPMSLRVFERVVRDGLRAAEAAAELGVPIKTVYNAKHRVLKRLRELRHDIELLQ